MKLQRHIARVVTLPQPETGFMGAGHTAVPVVTPGDFGRTDPFILLMDDRVESRDGRLGEAHPHAGFETVTFMLEGAVSDRDEGELEAGDALWMTAGSGVIHNEDVVSRGRVRLLQLWLTLPKGERWAPPSVQRIPLAGVPVRREGGATVRLYSGHSGDLESPTSNHVPVTMADIGLEPGAAIAQELPTPYSAFLYVIEGSLRVGGPEGQALVAGQVGWLDRPTGHGTSELRLVGGDQGGRAVLYAGQPTRDWIASHGPFVADREEDLVRLYQEYRDGRFPRMSEIVAV